MKNNVLLTVGAALLASLPMIACASTPEPAPAATTDAAATEAKPAEGSCGADKKAGEGSCGADKKAGEGSCGADKKSADGEKKAGEGSCGEGSCGGAKK